MNFRSSFFFLLFVPFFANATKRVILPDAETLQKRLQEQKFDHFIKNTDIIRLLADKALHPVGVSNAVELAYYDYYDSLKKQSADERQVRLMVAAMRVRKPELFEVVLKDHPEALIILQQRGKYKPINKSSL